MDAPAYAEISTHDDLIAWSREYAREVRREWFVDVRFDLVDWEVSTRAKRRAAAVKRPEIRGAEVGTEIDWETAETVDGRQAEGRPFPATLSLTWGAYESFDRDQWASTVRHELIHLEQYQQFGTTDHGPAFKERAEELDTEVHCDVFTEPEYVVRCRECDSVVANRYRDCDIVQKPEEYKSGCCGAALVVIDP